MRKLLSILAGMSAAFGMAAAVGAAPAAAVDVGTQAAPTGPPATMAIGSSVSAPRFVPSGGGAWNCTSMTVSGAAIAGSYAVLPASIGLLQLQFSGCTVSGAIPATVTCSGFAVINMTGPPVGTWFSLTPLNVAGISCSFTVSPSCNAVLSGTLTGEYRNPLGALQGVLVLDGSAGLALSGSTCPLIVDGPATLAQGGSSLPLVITLNGSGVDHPFIR